MFFEAEASFTFRPDQAFRKSKQLLSSENVLHHFDMSKPLVITCGIFPCGIGAVLSHRLEYNQKAPVAFYSRTLITTD